MKKDKNKKKKNPILAIIISALVLSGLTAALATFTKGFSDWTPDLSWHVDESNRLKISDFHTNDVESYSDLVEGNIYHIDIIISEVDISLNEIWAYYIYNGSISKYQDNGNWGILVSKVPLIDMFNDEVRATISFYKNSGGKLKKATYEDNLHYSADFVYASGGSEALVNFITKCAGAIES